MFDTVFTMSLDEENIGNVPKPYKSVAALQGFE